MRQELALIDGKRRTFKGIFVRYGVKRSYRGRPKETILLRDVEDIATGQYITDHLWFNKTMGFAELGILQPGDVVKFTARVKEYYKGYAGYREEVQWEKPIERDYRLSHPTKLSRLTK